MISLVCAVVFAACPAQMSARRGHSLESHRLVTFPSSKWVGHLCAIALDHDIYRWAKNDEWHQLWKTGNGAIDPTVGYLFVRYQNSESCAVEVFLGIDSTEDDAFIHALSFYAMTKNPIYLDRNLTDAQKKFIRKYETKTKEKRNAYKKETDKQLEQEPPKIINGLNHHVTTCYKALSQSMATTLNGLLKKLKPIYSIVQPEDRIQVDQYKYSWCQNNFVVPEQGEPDTAYYVGEAKDAQMCDDTLRTEDAERVFSECIGPLVARSIHMDSAAYNDYGWLYMFGIKHVKLRRTQIKDIDRQAPTRQCTLNYLLAKFGIA
mmetsp:Transcript_88238/g.248399  ORF Transcript_88238/g.248399 Transcript_88238/m.248399 type:complete len:319 (-) Transcript_88238:58-1014(-)